MFLRPLQDGVALDGSLVVRVVVAGRALPELGEHGGAAAQLAGPGRHGVEDCRTEDLITDHSEGCQVRAYGVNCGNHRTENCVKCTLGLVQRRMFIETRKMLLTE